MKKALSVIIIVGMMLGCLSMVSTASQIDNNIFYYDNGIEVTIKGGNLTTEEMKKVSDFIVYGNEGVSPCGLACIFGHDLTTTYAEETIHNAYTTSPMCLVNTYKVETCTRSSCDYINKTLIDSYGISSCHG